MVDKISLDISVGVYKSGDLLPPISQLNHMYEISRDTALKAFLDLEERGIIDSTPGRGYYVAEKLKNVFLLLDEYSLFKHVLHSSFVKRLSIHYRVDLLFRQYSECLSSTIIRESLRRYDRYTVMNFDDEKLSPNLYKIDPSKLFLLDFDKSEKEKFSYICQNFDQGFYSALLQLVDRLKECQKLVFVLVNGSMYSRSSRDFFEKFRADQHLGCEIMSDIERLQVHKGRVYIVIHQIDVVNTIERSHIGGLQCGINFDLVGYSDIPVCEVIDQRVIVLSVDWEKIRDKAAELVPQGKTIQDYLPTKVRLRTSLQESFLDPYVSTGQYRKIVW